MSRLENIIKHRDNQAEAFNAGRELVFAKTGNYSNACAATCSAWLVKAKIFQQGEVYLWTARLVTALEDHGFIRINQRHYVKAGDVIVTLDRNQNNAPDHVCIALGMPDNAEFVSVVDNQQSGEPYRRNLGSGSFTPMDYALRQPPDFARPTETTLKKLREIRRSLHNIYLFEGVIPQQARRYLNLFANDSFLDSVRDE